MKIKLHNFKCYSDETFEFGTNGIVLISGSSGSGKTSILTGIHFALYGNGNDLIADGKGSCFVELDFGDFWVKRTKRPNRLVVRENDIEYEDDSAQDIISRRFGSTFETCGYIAQDAVNSFITMSPIDKLAFLEKFAFRDINLSSIKARCKNLIKETNDELVSITSKVDMTRSVLDGMTKPTKIEFPIKCSNANRDKAVKNENIRYNNTQIMIKKKTKTLNLQKDELSNLRVYNTFLKGKNDMLAAINTKISKLIEEEKTIDYHGDDELKIYQEKLEHLLSFRELISLESQYSESLLQLQEMKEQETTNNNEEIKTINNMLWKDYSRDELRESLEDCKICLEDMERLNKLETEIKRYKINKDELKEKESKLEELREDVELKKDLLSRIKIEGQVYACPVCQSNLQICDEDLCVANDTNQDASEDEIEEIEQEIVEMSEQIHRLERLIPELRNKKEKHSELSKQIAEIREQYDDIPTISSLKDDIEYLRNYESSQLDLERRKKVFEKNIKCKTYSVGVTTFEKDVEKQKKRIQELKLKTKIKKKDLNEEELKQIIETQKRYKLDLTRIKTTKRDLLEEKTQIEYDIENETEKYTTKYPNIGDVSELKEQIETLESELQELHNKKEEHAKNIRAIEKYTENQKEIIKYKEWQDKLKKVTADEKKAREKYSAATILKEKILEAESVAMLNIISSINTHAQVYLDEFFPDSPISIRLLPFKETKKSTKPQINLEVEYKGMECGISRLSGGQRSRVVLAFTLALADMFNIPLIMLDECTSSLDQDLNNIVINSLREHFQNKLVLIIAHQSVEGVYDKIIKIT